MIYNVQNFKLLCNNLSVTNYTEKNKNITTQNDLIDTINNNDISFVNFKSSKQKTANGNEYLHTNNAFIAGTLGCASAPILTSLLKIKSKTTKSKIALNAFLFTTPLMFLGALADIITNKERQKAADLVANVGPKKALLYDEDLEISKNGKVYKPTKNGTLVAAAAVGTTLILSTLSYFLFKKGVVKNKIFKHFGEIFKLLKEIQPEDEISTFITLLPLGLILSPLIISDFINNKQAQKSN